MPSKWFGGGGLSRHGEVGLEAGVGEDKLDFQRMGGIKLRWK